MNAILGLAKSLALPTTAEGIEDAEVLERMTKAGVDTGQGYYFSKALPAAEATAWMEGEARQEPKLPDGPVLVRPKKAKAATA